uniref:Putative secreted peptide n=1 Tax=Anopheles braziliensis TaxID=58242 RepID=A0A2M3ZRP8_9DIPT
MIPALLRSSRTICSTFSLSVLISCCSLARSSPYRCSYCFSSCSLRSVSSFLAIYSSSYLRSFFTLHSNDSFISRLACVSLRHFFGSVTRKYFRIPSKSSSSRSLRQVESSVSAT